MIRRIKLFQTKLDFCLQGTAMYSTGLYLPTNITGEIKADEENEAIKIIIVSLKENYKDGIQKEEEKATLASIVPLNEKVIRISTEKKGGMVFITKSSEGIINISLKFNYFTFYPIAFYKSPVIWQKTQNIDLNVGEIFCKSIIFTLPKEAITSVNDLDIVYDFYNRIQNEIDKVLVNMLHHMLRIFFDFWEKSLDYKDLRYPVILPIKFIDQMIIDPLTPTREMFLGIMMLVRSILHKLSLCINLENCLSCCITLIVLENVYNESGEKFHDFVPDEMKEKTLQMIEIIKRKGYRCIQNALEDSTREERSDEKLKAFCAKLESFGDNEFCGQNQETSDNEQNDNCYNCYSCATNMFEKLEEIKDVDEEEDQIINEEYDLMDDEEEEEEEKCDPIAHLRRYSYDVSADNE